MLLGQIELGLYDRLGYNSSPDSAVTRIIRTAINQTQRQILGMKPFARLRRAVLTCTSVANTPFMVLPQAAVSIAIITDRNNKYPLDEISLQELRFRDPGLTGTASNPNAYAILNYAAAVARDPAAQNSLWAVSDSAIDGSGISISIEGTAGGYYRRASLTLNGTTAVNLASTISTWEHVTKFYASAVASGNISLLEGSGVGTELARIAPGHSSGRYTQLHLSPTPGSALTYYCDCELHVEDMVNVNDEPMIPEDFHFLLPCGVMKMMHEKREKTTLWKIEDAMWTQGLKDLKVFIAKRGGIAQGRSNNRRFSQFTGPNSYGI